MPSERVGTLRRVMPVDDAACPSCDFVASAIAYSSARKRGDATADAMVAHLAWRHDARSPRSGHE